MGKQVIVVGGGLVGAAFAYHLARAGASVRLMDQQRHVGGVATPLSWAWINASWGNPEHYFLLRHHSMQLWRQLDKDIAGLSLRWCGGLLWDLADKDLLAFVEQQSAWGYGVRLVGARDCERLEPAVAAPPAQAAHVAEEGVVEPVHAVDMVLRAAQSLGADVLQGVRVKRLVDHGGRVTGVMTDDGVLEADEVVLAAGAATNDLLSPLGHRLQIDTPAGLLVHTEPVGELLNGLVMAPRLHVRQTAEGRLVAGTDFGGTDPGENPEAAAVELFQALQAFLTGGEELRLSHHTIGYRPTPRDGVSAIGRIPGLAGLYVCCSHSGVTLAPALGALGAADILGGETPALIAPFKPDRLLEHV
jgi:glycine/D-amino acid oxidase-like deaminating enzyme